MLDSIVGIGSRGYSLTMYNICEFTVDNKKELDMIIYDESKFKFAFRLCSKERYLVYMDTVSNIKKLTSSDYISLKQSDEPDMMKWMDIRKDELLRSREFLVGRIDFEEKLRMELCN